MQKSKETLTEKIFNIFYLLTLPAAIVVYFINL